MAEMDIAYDNSIGDTKKVFSCKSTLFGYCNISFNSNSSMVILWNKYQVFVYENYNFDDYTTFLLPEFFLKKAIVANNYLVCLDCNGNLHTISLKFKTAAQKRLKTSFQSRERGIVGWHKHSKETILCLKLESGTYVITLHKVSPDFEILNRTVLRPGQNISPLMKTNIDNCIFKAFILNDDTPVLSDVFNFGNRVGQHTLVATSFDKRSIYCHIFGQKQSFDDINLVKIFDAPGTICDIEIFMYNNIVHLLVALTSGTLIKLNLKNSMQTPDIIHLNTAISKFIILKDKDTVIYTDGNVMWKTENTFSTTDIEFTKFFVCKVKDFIQFGDQILCTTFTDHSYLFSLEDETAYLRKRIEEYVVADRVLKDIDYCTTLMEELDDCRKLNEKVEHEHNYIVTLALASRQDIMDTIISHKIKVYENYEEVIKEYNNVALTHKFKKYFEPNIFFILVQLITTEMQHKLSDVLSNVLGDIKIHITLVTEVKQIYSTTVRLSDNLKQLNMLLPVQETDTLNTIEMYVNIKFIANIPSALDEREMLWVPLYNRQVLLNSEHLIKTKLILHKNVMHMKQPKKSIEEMIMKINGNHHGNLFKFFKNQDLVELFQKSLYVKLPKNYKQLITDGDRYKDVFSPAKKEFLIQNLSSEEFLLSKTNVILEIGEDKVIVEVKNDSTVPQLKITSKNAKLTFNIRNFLSNLIYGNYSSYGPEKEYVGHDLHALAEDIQKTIADTSDIDKNEFFRLMEEYDRYVFGFLPL